MASLTTSQVRDDGSGWNDVIVLANSAGTQNAATCRAWANADSTGVIGISIRASFNIDSIGDGGTGLFNVNFTNSFPDINYTITCCGDNNGSTTSVQFVGPDPSLAGGLAAVFAVNEVAIVAKGSGGSRNNAEQFNIAAFR